MTTARTLTLLGGTAAVALLLLLTSLGSATGAQTTGDDCPTDALRLTRDAPAPATTAALAEAAGLYQGIDTRRARVNLAARAASAGPRGRMVRRMCGRRVARRTVVVDLLFPEMLPSASLSQGTVFVARFADGYHVWSVAH